MEPERGLQPSGKVVQATREWLLQGKPIITAHKRFEGAKRRIAKLRTLVKRGAELTPQDEADVAYLEFIFGPAWRTQEALIGK